MTVSRNGWSRLRRAGFLDSEIIEFDQATDSTGNLQPQINLNTPVWQAAMKSRYDWIQDKVARGWTKQQIISMIRNYYAKSKTASPWDFLKAEYRPAKKTDFITALRRRTQKKLRKARLR